MAGWVVGKRILDEKSRASFLFIVRQYIFQKALPSDMNIIFKRVNHGDDMLGRKQSF